MSCLFLMIHYNHMYKNIKKLNSLSTRNYNTNINLKLLNKHEGCIKRKILLKSVVMNYLNK